jgi:predicted ArsR family transcriptional regulator
LRSRPGGTLAQHELSGGFYETTRGRVLLLLRRGPHTVEELARELGLTDNAVRAHLAALERDGFARQAGLRRGVGAGKPATVYEIDPGVEPLFSRAYAPVLLALLDELGSPFDRGTDASDLMHAVGRRLAATLHTELRPHLPRSGSPGGYLSERAQAAVNVLAALGGEATIEHAPGLETIRGCGACPLGSAVSRHPGLCHAIESLLSEVAGAEVRSVCEHGDRPRCGFELRAVA